MAAVRVIERDHGLVPVEGPGRRIAAGAGEVAYGDGGHVRSVRP
jgi:hypothetical protein